MRRIFISWLIAMAMAFSGNLQAEAIIDSGSISGVWKKSNSPYRITGNIHIDSGSNLAIEAGVKVLFTGRYQISVLGRINALGSTGDSISFSGLDTGWNGIAIGNLFLSHSPTDTCAFSYCSFSGARNSALKSLGTAPLFVSNCLFSKNANESQEGGAIITAYGTTVTVTSCRFIDNSTTGGGGAIRFHESNATVENSTFINNSAAEYGGAIYSIQETENFLRISGCDFNGNNAQSGGAVFNREPKLSVLNSKFINNAASDMGGAIYSQGPLTTLTNCLIANNRAHEGGAIFSECVDEQLRNCTIVNNFADTRGGGIFLTCTKNSTTSFLNTILFGNVAGTKCSQLGRRDCVTPSIKNCLVEGGIDKDSFYVDYPQCKPFEYVDNLTQKPSFKSVSDSAGNCSQALSSDWRLAEGSAGIDRGSAYTDMPSIDLVGKMRVAGSGVDMGAFEYQLSTLTKNNSQALFKPEPMRGKQTFFSDNNGDYRLLTLSGRKIPSSRSNLRGVAKRGRSLYLMHIPRKDDKSRDAFPEPIHLLGGN
jgi:predicted outer membrane repeat protein